jgi:hypothetical protein
MAGLFGIPRFLRARRAIQRARRVSDAELLRVLTPIGDMQSCTLETVPDGAQ